MAQLDALKARTKPRDVGPAAAPMQLPTYQDISVGAWNDPAAMQAALQHAKRRSNSSAPSDLKTDTSANAVLTDNGEIQTDWP